MMARTTAVLDQMIQKLEDQLSLSQPPVAGHSGQLQEEKLLNAPSEPEQMPVAIKCTLFAKPEESKAEVVLQTSILNAPSEPEQMPVAIKCTLFAKPEESKAEVVLQTSIPTETPVKVESKDPQPSSEKPEISHPIEESKAKTSHDKEEAPVDMSKAPYDLFPQIDIRVGKIVECWNHPSSENLYCEKIDVGEAVIREIGSGLQQYVPIADMSGNVCVMANLRPRKLGGFNSNGMVMALHKIDHGLELVRPGDVPVGERVGLEDMVKPEKSQILAPLNPKKKILEKAIGYFGTDAEGYACFGLKKLVTSAGFIKTNHPNSRIS